MTKYLKEAEDFRNALEVGRKAGNEIVPEPMHIAGYAPIADGLCGFAWVVVRPGNCALAKFLKLAYNSGKCYTGGIQYWVHDFNQSHTRKEAMARAMASYLRDKGYNVYADSRLD